MQRIAIIGAGISGLSAAHFLKDRYELTVFEKEDSPGGLIKCRRVNGNLVEDMSLIQKDRMFWIGSGQSSSEKKNSQRPIVIHVCLWIKNPKLFHTQ